MRWSPREPDAAASDAAASDDAVESLVVAALDELPDVFRVRLGSVAIVVEDEPTAEQLRSARAQGLFGLYQGVPRTSWAAEGSPYASKITLFRGPLLRASRGGADLADLVTDTVYHEIAHHFGISDARLREIRSGR